MSAELNLRVRPGLSVTVIVKDRFTNDPCQPSDLHAIAKALVLIARAVERGRAIDSRMVAPLKVASS